MNARAISALPQMVAFIAMTPKIRVATFCSNTGFLRVRSPVPLKKHERRPDSPVEKPPSMSITTSTTLAMIAYAAIVVSPP
ncbi:MAG: hypothetical protein V8T87_04920 [Victivallales bacterium]